MISLYVCLFSNGHLKVGRSVNALARISQHEERVDHWLTDTRKSGYLKTSKAPLASGGGNGSE